jgi:hypothetical protein
MNANANIVKQVEGKSTLVRPRFSPGLLLRDDDLTVGVDYTRELSRLLFQSLFGCGVVCGLRVSVTLECGKLLVTVDKGVALNAMGDPIYVPEPQVLELDPTCGKEIPGDLWVILCRKDKCCAPRSAICGCEEEESPTVCTREQEGFEIRLEMDQPGKCACMCTEQLIPLPPTGNEDATGECWCAQPCGCLKDHYRGDCACECWKPECVVLALLTDISRADRYPVSARKEAAAKPHPWLPNHSVRRFIRPVLMRDPVVFEERTGVLDPCAPPAPSPPPPPPAAAQQQGIASKASTRSKNK